MLLLACQSGPDLFRCATAERFQLAMPQARNLLPRPLCGMMPVANQSAALFAIGRGATKPRVKDEEKEDMRERPTAPHKQKSKFIAAKACLDITQHKCMENAPLCFQHDDRRERLFALHAC
jgi:hypothetical protein